MTRFRLTRPLRVSMAGALSHSTALGYTVPAGVSIGTIPTITFTRGTAGSVNLATGARTGTVTPSSGSWISGLNTSTHGVVLRLDSAPLPANVTLSLAGVLAYNGTDTGSDVTVSGIGVGVATLSDADWYNRRRSVTLWATRFDTDADVYGDPSVNFANSSEFWRNYTYHPNLSYSSPGNLNPRIYRQVGGGIGGANCMRQEHYASDNLQMGGWRRLFVNGQAQWPLNVPLYAAMYVRLPPSKFALGSTANNSWKVWILAGWGNSGWGSSNADRELAFQNTSDRRIIQHYTQGSPDLVTNNFPQSGDIQYQNQRDRGPGFTNKFDRYCLYAQYNTGACIRLLSDQWLGLYYRVVNRAGGLVDIDISYQYEGETEWTLLERYVNYNRWGTDEFNTLTVLSYTTARSGTAAQNTYQDVTEILLSENPIEPRRVW